MTLITTIEVDEIDTTVEVDFDRYFNGGIVINQVTDDLGNEVEINQFQEMILTDACHELAASL